MGVGKRILHPRCPETASYGLTRRQTHKKKTTKNAIKTFGAQWILEASGRRAALQHRPTADSARANGWRTVGGMWTDHVRSYTTPTLALGPRLRWVLAVCLVELVESRHLKFTGVAQSSQVGPEV